MQVHVSDPSISKMRKFWSEALSFENRRTLLLVLGSRAIFHLVNYHNCTIKIYLKSRSIFCQDNATAEAGEKVVNAYVAALLLKILTEAEESEQKKFKDNFSALQDRISPGIFHF